MYRLIVHRSCRLNHNKQTTLICSDVLERVHYNTSSEQLWIILKCLILCFITQYYVFTCFLQLFLFTEKFTEVTIFFSDIVTFTNIASASTPMSIVSMLNTMYAAFDNLSQKHDVYKVWYPWHVIISWSLISPLSCGWNISLGLYELFGNSSMITPIWKMLA